jgi:ATP-dependent DNA ligase
LFASLVSGRANQKDATIRFTTDKKAADKAGMRQPPLHELPSESKSCHAEVRLYAFDLMMDDSIDVRNETVAVLTSSTTTTRPATIGPRLFEPACKMGVEGIVSMQGEHGYKAGPCKNWIKVKIRNPR